MHKGRGGQSWPEAQSSPPLSCAGSLQKPPLHSCGNKKKFLMYDFQPTHSQSVTAVSSQIVTVVSLQSKGEETDLEQFQGLKATAPIGKGSQNLKP
jgi:hypothetical protein